MFLLVAGQGSQPCPALQNHHSHCRAPSPHWAWHWQGSTTLHMIWPSQAWALSGLEGFLSFLHYTPKTAEHLKQGFTTFNTHINLALTKESSFQIKAPSKNSAPSTRFSLTGAFPPVPWLREGVRDPCPDPRAEGRDCWCHCCECHSRAGAARLEPCTHWAPRAQTCTVPATATKQ